MNAKFLFSYYAFRIKGLGSPWGHMKWQGACAGLVLDVTGMIWLGNVWWNLKVIWAALGVTHTYRREYRPAVLIFLESALMLWFFPGSCLFIQICSFINTQLLIIFFIIFSLDCICRYAPAIFTSNIFFFLRSLTKDWSILLVFQRISRWFGCFSRTHYIYLK